MTRGRRQRGRKARTVAVLAALAALAACAGDADPAPATPSSINVTSLGVWEEGGRRNTLPVPPTFENGSRLWGLVQTEGPGGTHRMFDAVRATRDGHNSSADFDVVYEGPDGRPLTLHASPPATQRVGDRDLPLPDRRFEANPTLALDATGRRFAAWEEGSRDWGLGEALREERRIVMAASDDGASWFRVPLPPDEVLAAPLPSDTRFGGIPTAPAGRCVEAPRLLVDEAGIPWLVYRWLTRWMPADHARQSDGAGGANRRAAWRLRAMALTNAGWTAPADLGRSDGPADGGLELEALEGGGIRVHAYTDQRLQNLAQALAWEAALPGTGGWLTSELRLEGVTAPPGAVSELGPSLGPLAEFVGQHAKYPLNPSVQVPPIFEPQLLFADLHRHTDASRCKIEEDGTLLDQVRYAVEVGGLDVLSVTNHFQHATEATWERELAFADAFDGLSLARRGGRSWLDDDRDALVVLPGYERALPIGHWTMVADPERHPDANLREAPFGPFRPRFLWDDHEPETWLAMPHQIADRAAPLDWRTDSGQAPPEGSAFEPLAELYQSRRGSYEVAGGWLEDLGVDADAGRLVDYLNAGRRFGFAASSDHTTSSRAYTGIWLESHEDATRAAVLAALRARRTYAATDDLYVRAHLGDAPMGAVVEGTGKRQLRVDVRLARSREGLGSTEGRGGPTIGPDLGTRDRIAAVELVKNGEVVHRWAGEELDEEGRRRGLLTLRVGRSVQDQEVALVVDGDAEDAEDVPALLGEPIPFRTEHDDVLTGDARSISLAAALDTRDEDGFTVPITWQPGAGVTATFVHPKETTARSEDLDALAEAGSTGVFRVRGGRAELRLDPPVLSGTRFEAELELDGLEPGDWLYLRLRTKRGEAAWCSPWFVE